MYADFMSSYDRKETHFEDKIEIYRKGIFQNRRLSDKNTIYSFILYTLQTSIQWKAMNRGLVRLPRIRLRRRLRRARMEAAHQDLVPNRLARFHRPAGTLHQHRTTMHQNHHTHRQMIRDQCRRHPIIQTMM